MISDPLQLSPEELEEVGKWLQQNSDIILASNSTQMAEQLVGVVNRVRGTTMMSKTYTIEVKYLKPGEVCDPVHQSNCCGIGNCQNQESNLENENAAPEISIYDPNGCYEYSTESGEITVVTVSPAVEVT